MEELRRSFEELFNIQLESPLENSGEIQNNNSRIKYILQIDNPGNKIIDLLLFDGDHFPPQHKRINARGQIQDLENFQFSIMYERPEDRVEEELKMKEVNKKIARILIKKGLAEKCEEWIQKYL
ncbi:MAG TPA: hypothetical protein VK941_02320 [Gillisia sp.]|nr:hypothetical protein [Gillisia sp.]